jgi:hypothetical protein
MLKLTARRGGWRACDGQKNFPKLPQNKMEMADGNGVLKMFFVMLRRVKSAFCKFIASGFDLLIVNQFFMHSD